MRILIRMMASSPYAQRLSSASQAAVTDTFGGPLPAVVGQIDSAVRPGRTFAVRLPSNLIPQSETIAGRYFLLRCSNAVGTEREADWSIFLRRALFTCGRQAIDQHERWLFFLPKGWLWEGGQADLNPSEGQYVIDEGVAWMANRAVGELLNLHGPFGNGFSLLPGLQNILLLADIEDDPAWFWKLMPLCEQALDRGARVTMLIKASNEEAIASLVPYLPVQVEACTTLSSNHWLEQIGSTVAWADQVCAGVPSQSYGELLTTVRNGRFRVDRNYAQVLVNTDLLCAVGACLVCAVPTARGGFTRACMHGPVFDLTDLAD